MTAAADLLARLQRHYINPSEPYPGGAFLPEVTLGSRRADALYVGFTTGSGKRLVGHELKVSRSDWLHELAQPAKADAWMQHCHQWYLVVPNESVAAVGELPEGWGLMMPSKRARTRMEIISKSPVRDVTPNWEAVHELLKKADTIRASAFAEGKERGRFEELQRQTRRSDEDFQRRARDLTEKNQDLTEQIAVIESTIGMPITRWANDRVEGVTAEEFAGAFRRYLAADRDITRALQLRYSGIRTAAERLTAAVEALDGMQAVMDS